MVWEWYKRQTHMAPSLTVPFSETGKPCTAMKRLHMGTAKQCGSGSMKRRASEGQKAGPGGSPPL